MLQHQAPGLGGVAGTLLLSAAASLESLRKASSAHAEPWPGSATCTENNGERLPRPQG